MIRALRGHARPFINSALNGHAMINRLNHVILTSPIVFNLCIFCHLSVIQANEIERKFQAAGLVDIHKIDPSIRVDLVNSDPNKNFFRENFYSGLDRAYLQKEVAIKLSKAQKMLKSGYPEYSLLIYDAARPRSVSRKMYEKVKGTGFEKFVAHPDKGSMHNYGIAVDITIVDGRGRELDMGPSPFRKSTLKLYWQYLKMKLGQKLSDEQVHNRKLLARIMRKAGFLPLGHEWWHFNGISKEKARKRYKLIE